MSAPHEHLSCELLITGICTMRCSYCIAADVPATTMSEATARDAVDLFVYLAEGGKTIEFVFTGGEPLVAFPVMKALASYAERRTNEAGMRASFVLKTNGTVLNAEVVEFLRAHSVTVVVSMDGPAEVHDRNRRTTRGRGTHSTIRRNLVTLLDGGILCSVSLTVHPDSVSEIMRSVRYLHELGVGRIDVAPAYGTVVWTANQAHMLAQSLEDIARYVRQVNCNGGDLEVGPLYRDSEHVDSKLSDTWGCHAAVKNLAFLPNGDIAGCSALAMLASRYPELIIGNSASGIQQESIDRILNLSQASGEQRLACVGCQAANDCTGGCLAINYATTGRPLVPPSVYCETISSIPCAWQLAWKDVLAGQSPVIGHGSTGGTRAGAAAAS